MKTKQPMIMDKNILLVGAGPGHLAVLRQAASFRQKGIRLKIMDVNPFYFMPNMAAEVMSGYYGLQDFHIDLKQVADKRGVEFIHDEAIALLLKQKKLMTTAGRLIDYDAISFEIGSEPAGPEDDIPAEGSFPVRPVKNVLQIRNEIETLLEMFPKKRIVVAVLGGGLSGVEYAINMSEILQQRCPSSGWQVMLLEAQPEILPGFPKPAIAVARKMLAVNDVEIRTSAAVQHVQSNRFVLDYGETVEFDLAVVAIGQTVSNFFNHAGLDTDDTGALKVGATLQSVFHPELFACGDCAAVQNRTTERTVARAYQQGRLLADNLKRFFSNQPLQAIKPYRHSIRFASLGKTNAFCLFGGGRVLSGPVVLSWKRWREKKLFQLLAR